MASKTGGGLVTISFVLPERHVAALREIAAERSSDWQRISMANVGREVVEEGLKAIRHAADSDFIASGTDENAA